MSILVALNHRTEYRYDRRVALGPQTIRLRPAPHCRTPILSYSLRIEPSRHFVNWQQDPQSNYQARVVFPEKTDSFSVEVDLIAEMSVYNPFDFFLEPTAELFPFAYDEALQRELKPYLTPLTPGPALSTFMERVPRDRTPTINFLVDLNQRIADEIRYIVREEPGVQTPEETLGLASGSCRDSGWLLVQVLRNLGLAARFASGYLIQLTPDRKSLDGPSGPAEDFTDLHAWAEVYLPGAGWVGFDPTSGLVAGEGHIPLACTPEPGSAAPVSGLVDPATVSFAFTMSVRRIVETPRVTRPYDDAQWAAIDGFGRAVDAELQAGDVRLTMGGEPTFVSIDDVDGAEWNTAALGPGKRGLAADLVKRLQARLAPGSLLHFGQGKWYPGESLPRWAFNCYWRKDGTPLWRQPDLIADEGAPPGYDAGSALRFATLLAEHLHAADPHVIPAFEDNFYHLWKERQLPVNLAPSDPRLADPEERARLMRVFDRGLDQVVGYVLPLEARDGAWRSGPWFLRSEQVMLIPGDSPIGFRLPLHSLPWVAPADYPFPAERDPFEPRQELPRQLHRRRAPSPRPALVRRPALNQSAPEIVRTALAVEPRGGHLCLFLPPVAALEDFITLVAAIEECAAELGVRVVLEGYPPPKDPRLGSFSVTPDPGVIEVNVAPAASWDELVTNTTALYDEARACRLGTEKFMIDGRHVGTGGGNHLVIGGPTAPDSPLLRRPDLLRSLISYWHNHPALSYLFSGLFIGPTSQAPRIDEARDDAVYEIEIAFQQMAKETAPGQPCPPWLVDRLLRNLLVDVTGNTHRAEFCIDKLYSPDGPTGRLGLLELRAFEMPPDARMSLAQQVLLRALVARFWKTPYAAPLTRWGTGLHDRFLLPHFVEQDLDDVIADMNAAGYPIERSWFAPQLEFRFPRFGTVRWQGAELELRHALEPWHVLGEEGAAGGTVRYVDSSLERLQVKASGLTEGRHVIACNGRRLPLRPVGAPGAFVAGVRFRAWAPPNALHPTIPVQAPLTVDLIDLWSGRAVAGCTYHVAHPGGRNYETMPVNAYEAESRRLARFEARGHTPGVGVPPEAVSNPAFPFTLDLRRDA